MTAERMAEIEARLAATTPGPWKRDRNWYVTAEGHDWDKVWLVPGVTLENYRKAADRRVAHVFGPGEGNNAAEDFKFIAAAPDDVRWLLARVRELEADAARLDWLEEVSGHATDLETQETHVRLRFDFGWMAGVRDLRTAIDRQREIEAAEDAA